MHPPGRERLGERGRDESPPPRESLPRPEDGALQVCLPSGDSHWKWPDFWEETVLNKSTPEPTEGKAFLWESRATFVATRHSVTWKERSKLAKLIHLKWEQQIGAAERGVMCLGGGVYVRARTWACAHTCVGACLCVCMGVLSTWREHLSSAPKPKWVFRCQKSHQTAKTKRLAGLPCTWRTRNHWLVPTANFTTKWQPRSSLYVH